VNYFAWWLACGISRLLHPAEREAVYGDLAESHSSGAAALTNIFGLVVRRQLAMWLNWRPWLALVGIVALAGFLLSEFLLRFGTGIFLQLRTYFKYGVHYETGVSAMQDTCHLAILALALISWSWGSGFVLASLSGRTLWLTAPLFYVVVQNSFFTYSVLSGSTVIADPHPPLWLLAANRLLPLNPAQLFFVPAAIWGAYRGSRGVPLMLKPAITLAGFTAALTLLLFWSDGWYETALRNLSDGAWHTTPWPLRLLPILLLSWPFPYMLFANRHFKLGKSE
jgi:hypothetical protein